MKREEIKTIFPDATDEQLKAVMDLNGADVEKVKGKVTALEAEIKEKKEAIDNLSTEFNALKESNATAEDYKAKFEALQRENDEKEKKAEADRVAKEKAERIASRFNTVVGEKKFSHDAIKESYLKKFTEALESKDFEGKSDTDILHELTKDDSAAFTGVTAVKLAGGATKAFSNKRSKDEILSIKDGAERREAMAQAMASDPNFFD